MQHVKHIMMKKISNIKKKNNKYIITLGDNTQLEFYSDTLIKYNLLKPREIRDSELKEIINYNNYYEAFNKSLKLIGNKQRTKKELKDKLKDYPKEVIDKVIKKLEELGYLNEENYIKSYINDQINLGTKGPNYIKRELEKLDLSTDLIKETLDEVDNKTWTTKIEKIINKKINTNKKLSKNNLLLKIKKDLINLGFDIDMINNIVNSVEIKEDDEALEKEYQKEYKKLSRKYEDKELEIKLKYNLYKKGFNLSNIEKMINKY